MRRFQVTGNLTKDAEVKEVKNRKAINFGIAHNEVFKDTTGERLKKRHTIIVPFGVMKMLRWHNTLQKVQKY